MTDEESPGALARWAISWALHWSGHWLFQATSHIDAQWPYAAYNRLMHASELVQGPGNCGPWRYPS